MENIINVAFLVILIGGAIGVFFASCAMIFVFTDIIAGAIQERRHNRTVKYYESSQYLKDIYIYIYWDS